MQNRGIRIFNGGERACRIRSEGNLSIGGLGRQCSSSLGAISCYYTMMNRTAFIEKLTEIQRTVEQLLTQLQTSEHDAFAAHLYRSRREYRSACDHSGKSGKQIERCLISTFKVAESLGFKGDYRQWEHLLRIGD